MLLSRTRGVWPIVLKMFGNIFLRFGNLENKTNMLLSVINILSYLMIIYQRHAYLHSAHYNL